MPPLYAASPNHNFGHIREPHIFRDLCCRIFTMRCDDLCAKLLRQTLDRAANAALCLMAEGPDKAMNKFNG